jgi:hypothetical protein
VSIDERPAIVEERTRIGDWEVDTIIGKRHRQAIVTLTERKSRFSLLAKVNQRTADKVGGAVIELLQNVVIASTPSLQIMARSLPITNGLLMPCKPISFLLIPMPPGREVRMKI